MPLRYALRYTTPSLSFGSKGHRLARENLNDLMAFIVVAREKSFTKAAAHLGVSQSALSHTIRTLESRLGMKLLTRTTRSISLTDIGQSMLDDLGPYIDGIGGDYSH